MGNGLVRFQSQSQVQQQYIINRSIERDLEVEAKKKPIKLLLLGAGESGKSTVLKQMKIIHDNGFTLEERRQRKTVILNYTVRNTFDMLAAMKVMNIKLDSAELLGAADCICKYISSCEIATSLPDRLFHAMQLLWAYEGVRKAYSRRSEFQLEDTAKYFLDALDRLRKPDYVPTERDILMIRVPTCGVVEVSFPCKNQCFRVFDVGGQRSERKKWIHCFDDVDAIIFITSLSEYDQTTREDNATNRMEESYRLFRWIMQHECFLLTSVILFLNKRDLFAEKIDIVPLSIAYPDFGGPQGYQPALHYIRKKFLRLNKTPEKNIYVHVTCATDTQQVQVVLDSTFDTIITRNMQRSGLM